MKISMILTESKWEFGGGNDVIILYSYEYKKF